MIAVAEASGTYFASPVVVWNSKREHEDGHEKESHQLNFFSSYAVDEEYCDPVAWDC